jgi:hypothetical protein
LVTGVQLVLSFRSISKNGIRKTFKESRWISLWFVAFVLFYIALTGKANANMDRMLRYTLPPFILLLILGVREGRGALEKGSGGKAERWKIAAMVVSFALQLWCAYRFLHGKWVA